MEFDNWFDIFCDKLRSLGWNGNIDQDSAFNDFESGLSPEEAAISLYKELSYE